eukprot:scaffold83301_cov25-Cyclotella_meneghiniana.AAC.2
MDDVVPPRGLCVLVDIIGSVLVDIASDDDVDVVDEELQSVLRKLFELEDQPEGRGGRNRPWSERCDGVAR